MDDHTPCACKSRDASTCVRIRYNLPVSEPVDDPCTCECHDNDDEADEVTDDRS